MTSSRKYNRNSIPGTIRIIDQLYHKGAVLNRIAVDKRPIDSAFTRKLGYNRASLPQLLDHLRRGGKLFLVPASLGYFMIDVDEGNPTALYERLEEHGLAYFVTASRRKNGAHIYIEADDDILTDDSMTMRNGCERHGIRFDWRGHGGYAVIHHPDHWGETARYMKGRKLTLADLDWLLPKPPAKRKAAAGASAGTGASGPAEYPVDWRDPIAWANTVDLPDGAKHSLVLSVGAQAGRHYADETQAIPLYDALMNRIVPLARDEDAARKTFWDGFTFGADNRNWEPADVDASPPRQPLGQLTEGQLALLRRTAGKAAAHFALRLRIWFDEGDLDKTTDLDELTALAVRDGLFALDRQAAVRLYIKRIIDRGAVAHWINDRLISLFDWLELDARLAMNTAFIAQDVRRHLGIKAPLLCQHPRQADREALRPEYERQSWHPRSVKLVDDTENAYFNNRVLVDHTAYREALTAADWEEQFSKSLLADGSKHWNYDRTVMTGISALKPTLAKYGIRFEERRFYVDTAEPFASQADMRAAVRQAVSEREGIPLNELSGHVIYSRKKSDCGGQVYSVNAMSKVRYDGAADDRNVAERDADREPSKIILTSTWRAPLSEAELAHQIKPGPDKQALTMLGEMLDCAHEYSFADGILLLNAMMVPPTLTAYRKAYERFKFPEESDSWPIKDYVGRQNDFDGYEPPARQNDFEPELGAEQGAIYLDDGERIPF